MSQNGFPTTNLGNDRLEASGNVVTQYNYSPFGSTQVIGTNVPQPFRFTGREYDPETGLYCNRARYYSPDMRRFISEDPLRFGAGDVNWYAYVGGNPVNFIDPLGLRSLKPGEVHLARQYFGNAIDYNKVEIKNENWFLFLPLVDRPMAPNGNIYFDKNDPNYSSDFSKEKDVWMRALFIHEMTHVWQNQQGMWVKLRAAKRKYTYVFCPDKELTDYGIEQQASIIEDLFRLMNNNPTKYAKNPNRYTWVDYMKLIYRSVNE